MAAVPPIRIGPEVTVVNGHVELRGMIAPGVDLEAMIDKIRGIDGVTDITSTIQRAPPNFGI